MRKKKTHKRTAVRSGRKKAKVQKVKQLEKVVKSAGLATLDYIEKAWPGVPESKVAEAFSRLRAAIKNQASRGGGFSATPSGAIQPEKGVSQKTEASRKIGSRFFDLLDLIRRTLMAHDLLFLSRQVTYHIAADATLPLVYANADQVQFVFSQLIEHAVRRATAGSRISIALKKFILRNQQGIKLCICAVDRHLDSESSREFVGELFQNRPDAVSGVSLADCREVIGRQRGQLWVEINKPSHPDYYLVLPASEDEISADEAPHQTFKYDISISNYADVRRRFGIRKSISLVSQIEQCIKSLVRYPIDMVMSVGDKGIITTIYETQRGAAQSVASRISERLGSEKFCIGKRPVDVSFSYHLSPLASSATLHARENESKSSH